MGCGAGGGTAAGTGAGGGTAAGTGGGNAGAGTQPRASMTTGCSISLIKSSGTDKVNAEYITSNTLP